MRRRKSFRPPSIEEKLEDVERAKTDLVRRLADGFATERLEYFRFEEGDGRETYEDDLTIGFVTADGGINIVFDINQVGQFAAELLKRMAPWEEQPLPSWLERRCAAEVLGIEGEADKIKLLPAPAKLKRV